MSYIEGNQNVVGNGNTVLYGQPDHRPPPDHPNATTCPQCHQPTWVASDYCLCGYNLAAVRMERERKRQRRADFRSRCLTSGLGLIGLALFMAWVRTGDTPFEVLYMWLSIFAAVVGLCMLGARWMMRHE